MVRRLDEAYILNLDDLPKVAEADGIVWPVMLSLRESARLFHITPDTLTRWVKDHDIPVVKIGTSLFIEVRVLNDWITQHSYTPDEYREHRRNVSEHWRAENLLDVNEDAAVDDNL